MEKAVIFDFNRTLYDPERRRLIEGAEEALQSILPRGFSLYLISTAAPSRAELIREFGLEALFARIIITGNKKTAFRQLLGETDIDAARSFVVGDRVRSEISYGNASGLQTIWLRTGKFAEELPESPTETPLYTVASLEEAAAIICR